MAPSTGKNVILSLLLSLTLTVISAFLYYFYPLLTALVANAFSSHTDVGFVVAGGGSGSLLPLLLIASALFIIIFLLLQKRSAKEKVS